jgi:hypothetical protein
LPYYKQQEDLEKSCSLKKYNCTERECGDQFVSVGIGEAFKTWTPERPVFISAQMGGGKNYFIENSLLRHMEEINYSSHTHQKVLILSNRIALRKQIKKRFAKDVILEQYADVYSYQSLLDNLEQLLTRRESLAQDMEN